MVSSKAVELLSEQEPQDVAAMQSFIRNALELKRKGNNSNYDYLINQFQTNTQPEFQMRMFSALSQCVSMLTSDAELYHELLHVLFKFDWMSPSSVVEGYIDFLVHLLSTNTTYFLPTIQMFTKNLLAPKKLPVCPFSNKVDEESLQKAMEIKENHTHNAFDRILKLVPSGYHVVFPVLSSHFPHKRNDARSQLGYLKNLLRLLEYMPYMKDRILGLIVEKLVAIDVEIKLDETEEDMFTMDDFLDDAPDIETVDLMADKLDLMMLTMFEYLDQYLAEKGNDISTVKIFLESFEHVILNTHRSKHPQFLLFYICKRCPVFQSQFLAQLTGVMLDQQVPCITRQSSAAYLASFLSRAKFVDITTIKTSLNYIMQWIKDYMLEMDPDSTHPHTVFYSIFQAGCYIVCFRGLELSKSKEGRDFLRSFDWECLVESSMNPLSFCLDTVANEFLNVAEILGLLNADCIDLMDSTLGSAKIDQFHSKRSTNLERTMNPSNSSSSRFLDSFFPFDPFLLRRSIKYIGPDYIYWKYVDPSAKENEEIVSLIKNELQQERDLHYDSDTDASMGSAIGSLGIDDKRHPSSMYISCGKNVMYSPNARMSFSPSLCNPYRHQVGTLTPTMSEEHDGF